MCAHNLIQYREYAKLCSVSKTKKLTRLEVLKEENGSEWGAPYFGKTKAKTICVRFLSGFWNLNRKLKCKPYPMPKIREMLLK